MSQIPRRLFNALSEKLKGRGLGPENRRDYLKWLGYYLDFCAKYHHPPRHRDSLAPFLQKLASKNQSPARQKQAAAGVGIYFEVVENWLAACAPAAEKASHWESCLEKLKEEIRLRHYSPRTEQTYRVWIAQFRQFLKDKDPESVDSTDVQRFLRHLAVKKGVLTSTQNQAVNALLFLFRHIFKRQYDLRDKVVCARQTKSVPVVLSREEIDSILGRMKGARALAVQLLYGCGLRLFECLNLRMHCFNFAEAMLAVPDGKGRRDRTVPLPRSLIPALKKQMERVRLQHGEDLRAGYDGVFRPFALNRKWRKASKEFIWQWFFPAPRLTPVPEENERRRYHLHETVLQKHLREAVKKAGVPKRVTCHPFRHSLASHRLQANYDIRTIQEMLGHSDVRTPMIYAHTVKTAR